jgi:predicted metal-dependent peptidase
VWCVDTKVQDVKSNKEAFDIFKSANTLAKNSLALAGGGATDFKSAFERLLAIIERDKKDIMVIILTDAGLQWDIGMLQELENVIIVAPEEGSEYMPWNFLNNPKYPNAHGIVVNFFNNEYKTS